MVDTLIDTIIPSATPTEEEIAAWQELPRNEQLRRLRQMLTSPLASTPCSTTMAEIRLRHTRAWVLNGFRRIAITLCRGLQRSC